jgi:hypothetical protein
MSILARADLKSASKKLAEILKEKYRIEIKHSHALAVISMALGFRDWNTLSAMIGDKPEPTAELSEEPANVGDLFDLIKSLPRSMPLFAEYEYQEEDFDHDGGYSVRGRKRTQSIAAYKTGEGFFLEFDDPRGWQTLRETGHSYPSGTVTRSGLDSEDFLEFVRKCEREINKREGLRCRCDGKNVYLTQVFPFIEDEEIQEYGPDLAERYGVTLVIDKHNGLFVNDDNGQGYPSGNKEGFLDALKDSFRDRSEEEAFKVFKKFGFSNQISKWEPGNLLEITAQVKISDHDIANILRILLSAIEEYPFTQEELDKVGDLAGQLELDKRRGK